MKRRIGILTVILAAFVASAVFGLSALGITIGDVAQFHNTVMFRKGFTVGTPATASYVTQILYGCDAASDAAAGTWSSRSTSTSTSATFTLTGVSVGDACDYIPGAAVAAGGQALDWRCEISATNTVLERVTNASGGSLTPTTGKRCAIVTRAQ